MGKSTADPRGQGEGEAPCDSQTMCVYPKKMQ